MPSLQKADDRFMVRIEIIENGSGSFKGVVDEPSQGSVPAYQFTGLRRLLRTNPGVPVKTGMVVRTQGGAIFIVGELGDADNIFKSYRLFEQTGRYTWKRRGKKVDPVTQLEEDTGLVDQTPALIWGVYEPESREAFDRQMHVEFETGRFVTNQPIHTDDIVDGKRVSRVDKVLGVYMATLA